MKIGDKRKILKHAFFPTRVEGKWIWFKDYWVFQKCEKIHIEAERIAPFWVEEASTHLIWSTYDKKLVSSDCTCVYCPWYDDCEFAFDDYNTNGDCLAIK